MSEAVRPRRSALRIRNEQNRLIGLMIVGCAAFALSACGSSSDGKDKGSGSAPVASTPAPTTSSADPQAAERQAVLDAYSNYWKEQAKAYKTGTIEGTDLKKYAVGDAVARVESDLMTMKQNGVIADGAPRSAARVTDLDLQSQPAKATLSDCLDISTWKRLYRSTGKEVPAPQGRINRYLTVAKAEKWGKQWKILSATPEQKACQSA
ncbi:hypothetical protein ACH4UM_37860 [Streptomyces sp. NPDC020801]|uniref:hypothetical protein n=1 Tax=Streptomyces sp. NPDC020801 TaxID=3365093 RepID=UPI003788F4D7